MIRQPRHPATSCPGSHCSPASVSSTPSPQRLTISQRPWTHSMSASHRWPQPPQLFSSESTSPHRVQEPFMQTSSSLHRSHDMPQFVRSVSVFAPPQYCSHRPRTQPSLELQRLPHAPQLFLSVFTSGDPGQMHWPDSHLSSPVQSEASIHLTQFPSPAQSGLSAGHSWRPSCVPSALQTKDTLRPSQLALRGMQTSHAPASASHSPASQVLTSSKAVWSMLHLRRSLPLQTN